MTKPDPAQMRADLDRDGFVLIRKIISDEQIEKYRNASLEWAKMARNGDWDYIRTCNKMFPPFKKEDRHEGVWGVQHCLHPDVPPQLRAVFAESYFNDELVGCVKDILNVTDDRLVMELYNMLVKPEKDFALRWHRDDIQPTATAEEETERLKEPMAHAQWNMSLYNDSSLIVVPGSHKRPRTDAERNADPMENDMPGQLVVKMEPGDIVFYNNNIFHRGKYDSSMERMTLHGTIGTTGEDLARARNIMQHGIGSWAAKASFKDCGLEPRIQKRAEEMHGRLLAMGSGDKVEYSQTD